MITYPWLSGVEINTLYPLRAGEELPLYKTNSVSNLINAIISCCSVMPAASMLAFSVGAYLDVEPHGVWGVR